MPPPSNDIFLHERAQAVAETQRLLLQHTSDIFTPNYLPIEAIIEMQKIVGYKPNSNARPRKQAPYSSTELPRVVAGGVPTPSWFRYANMGEEVKGAPSIPEGYEWDVGYHRREDSSLATRPYLAELPKKKMTAKEKAEASFKRATRSMHVQSELTDDGIEDISSDEELYGRRSARTPSVSSDPSNSAEMYIDLESPGLITRTGRSAGSRSTSSTSNSSSASPSPSKRPAGSSASPRNPKCQRTMSLAGPPTATDATCAPVARVRIDSEYASTAANIEVGEDIEGMDADVEDDGNEAEDDKDRDDDGDEIDEVEEVDDVELVDAAALDDEDDEDWQS